MQNLGRAHPSLGPVFLNENIFRVFHRQNISRSMDPSFHLTNVGTSPRIPAMGQAKRPTCPSCGADLFLALPPGGKGQRTMQCFECDGPDPLKTDKTTGWLKGELRPPERGA